MQRQRCHRNGVTAATVVTEDMNITAKYTPIKVKIHINAPTPPIAGNTYSDVYTFEVDYGSTVDKNTIDGYIAHWRAVQVMTFQTVLRFPGTTSRIFPAARM